jgi:hypothetical protein
MRGLQPSDYIDRVNESVADTLKEQNSQVLARLFRTNNILLPPGKQVYDVIEQYVPTNDISRLADLHRDLTYSGVQADQYSDLVQIVITFWGG